MYWLLFSAASGSEAKVKSKAEATALARGYSLAIGGIRRLGLTINRSLRPSRRSVPLMM
ncbi:hypothetical protein [Rhizobium rhizoryzae]|uniref:hypothetical protein n=1 Tax=Rhizobium rhizoryzae TaxID=451876 RepID=UPI0028A0A110|nr:hypothetical protein [Rhizobium rhizoryzae]